MHTNDLLSLVSLHVFYTPKLQPKLYEDNLRKRKHIYYYSSPAVEVAAVVAAAAAAASQNLKFHA